MNRKLPQDLKKFSRKPDLNPMRFDDYPLARNTKAHEVFLDELEKQLQQLSVLKSRSTSDDITSSEDIKTYVHRLKGGAGFFGYDSLQSTAAQIEDLLEQPMQRVEGQRELLSRLIDKLEGLAHTISKSE